MTMSAAPAMAAATSIEVLRVVARKRRCTGCLHRMRLCLCLIVVLISFVALDVRGHHAVALPCSRVKPGLSCSSFPSSPVEAPQPQLPFPSQQEQHQEQDQQQFTLHSSIDTPLLSSSTRGKASTGKRAPSTGPFSPSPSTSARFSTNHPHLPHPQNSQPLNNSDLTCSYTSPDQSCSDSTLHPMKSSEISKSDNLGDINVPGVLPTEQLLQLSAGDGSSKSTSSPRRVAPDPIVFQFTIYYPGNIPLVVTAGHGGSSIPGEPVSRRMTHSFKRVHNLASTSARIDPSSFSEPLPCSKNDTGATMPWMPPRDPSQGGNLKRDLNTNSMALNLANAVACLTSSGQSQASLRKEWGHHDSERSDVARKTANIALENIPERCRAQGSSDKMESDLSPPSSSPSTAPFSVCPERALLPGSDSQTRGGREAVTANRTRLPSPVHNFPHVVLFRVHRRFVDVNRNITGENAIADHPVSEAAWREYHDVIDHVQKMAVQQQKEHSVAASKGGLFEQEQEQQEHSQASGDTGSRQSPWSMPDEPVLMNGPGLLLDIHGHTHSSNLIEIGYLLSGSVLSMEDEQIDAISHNLTQQSSIRSLISRVVRRSSFSVSEEDLSENDAFVPSSPARDESPIVKANPASYWRGDPVSFSTLFRGRNESLGGMLQHQGLNAVPSPNHKAPCRDCIYFFGGYTVHRHGTLDNDYSTDAIQLELPKTVRLVDKEERAEIGMQLGKAVVQFMTRYYGVFEDQTASSGNVTDGHGCGDGVMEQSMASAREQKPAERDQFSRGGLQDDMEVHQKEGLRSTQRSQLERSYMSGRQRRSQQQHPHRARSESSENDSGDSETDDWATNDSKNSARRLPQMKCQTSRL